MSGYAVQEWHPCHFRAECVANVVCANGASDDWVHKSEGARLHSQVQRVLTCPGESDV